MKESKETGPQPYLKNPLKQKMKETAKSLKGGAESLNEAAIGSITQDSANKSSSTSKISMPKPSMPNAFMSMSSIMQSSVTSLVAPRSFPSKSPTRGAHTAYPQSSHPRLTHSRPPSNDIIANVYVKGGDHRVSGDDVHISSDNHGYGDAPSGSHDFHHPVNILNKYPEAIDIHGDNFSRVFSFSLEDLVQDSTTNHTIEINQQNSYSSMAQNNNIREVNRCRISACWITIIIILLESIIIVLRICQSYIRNYPREVDNWLKLVVKISIILIQLLYMRHMINAVYRRVTDELKIRDVDPKYRDFIDGTKETFLSHINQIGFASISIIQLNDLGIPFDIERAVFLVVDFIPIIANFCCLRRCSKR